MVCMTENRHSDRGRFGFESAFNEMVVGFGHTHAVFISEILNRLMTFSRDVDIRAHRCIGSRYRRDMRCAGDEHNCFDGVPQPEADGGERVGGSDRRPVRQAKESLTTNIYDKNDCRFSDTSDTIALGKV
jgi:hypothetical protein